MFMSVCIWTHFMSFSAPLHTIISFNKKNFLFSQAACEKKNKISFEYEKRRSSMNKKKNFFFIVSIIGSRIW